MGAKKMRSALAKAAAKEAVRAAEAAARHARNVKKKAKKRASARNVAAAAVAESALASSCSPVAAAEAAAGSELARSAGMAAASALATSVAPVPPAVAAVWHRVVGMHWVAGRFCAPIAPVAAVRGLSVGCDLEFLVDSGAGETIVTPGVAAQWGAPVRETIQVVDANQHVIQAAGGAPLYGWVHDDSGARVRE